MKHKKAITSIIKIIAIIIVVLLTAIFSLSYRITKNKDWEENVIKTIKDKTNTQEKINYINYYNNYYIYKTDNNVVVLNNEYQEVEKFKSSDLAENKDNYELIYKTKKLMYEKSIIEKNKVTYEYYDAKTYQKISSTTLEKE